jgi:hypothetical protein
MLYGARDIVGRIRDAVLFSLGLLSSMASASCEADRREF